jgi:hypothetical protein
LDGAPVLFFKNKNPKKREEMVFFFLVESGDGKGGFAKPFLLFALQLRVF